MYSLFVKATHGQVTSLGLDALYCLCTNQGEIAQLKRISFCDTIIDGKVRFKHVY